MGYAAAKIEPMFRRLDTDRNGFLSLAEYRKTFRRRLGVESRQANGSKENPAIPGAQAAAKVTPDQEKFFEEKIRPVLASRCGKCHSSAAEELRGGLRTDSRGGSSHGGRFGRGRRARQAGTKLADHGGSSRQAFVSSNLRMAIGTSTAACELGMRGTQVRLIGPSRACWPTCVREACSMKHW